MNPPLEVTRTRASQSVVRRSGSGLSAARLISMLAGADVAPSHGLIDEASVGGKLGELARGRALAALADAAVATGPIVHSRPDRRR
jgi:hypothetical protein